MSDKKFYLLEDRTSKSKFKNKNKIILNTKVSLSRNLVDHKFVDISGSQEKIALLEEIKKYVDNNKKFGNFQFYDIKVIKGLQRELFLMDYMIDSEMSRRLSGKGVYIKEDRAVRSSSAIIINNEDHVRIQSVYPGLKIYKAYNEVMKIEKYFEKGLTFAFDRKLGYLTASPSNLGTALRVSVIVHLPVLAASTGLVDLLKRIGKIGCQIGGYFRSQPEVTGNLFEVYNGVTLGKGEREILDEMKAICLSIIEEEQKARAQIKRNDLLGIKDNVYRSYGLIKYSKILSYEEALELLSIIRLGLDLDLIDDVNDFDFFELVNKLSDSRIMVDMEINDKIKGDRIDLIRADIIREKILKGS